jgi:5-methyltetrahydropteroyltriglutamate--homocysteine methyltransferase
MTIPTEPIGSIPRPLKLLDAIKRYGGSHPSVEPLYDEAIRDTIEQFEATGSPVITDGEQRKYHNFATYCVEGLPNTSPDGFKLPFANGHARRWPRLTGGPFRFLMYGYDFLDRAMKYAHVPVKQAVISPSALSLMYPQENLPGYSREEFIEDLLGEHEKEIRGCLAKGAHKVQIDFTEGRLAVKIDPSGALLNSFIELNNLALSRFSKQERSQIGVHTCPGSDRDSTHSADVDYAELLPSLFELQAGNFYVALAGEPDRTRVLKIIRKYLKPGQDIRRSRFTHRSANRRSRRNTRPHPGGSAIHLRRTTWHHGRLRLLAILRRHFDHARKGVCEDSLPCGGNAAGGRNNQWQIEWNLRTKRKSSGPPSCRQRPASFKSASAPSRRFS